MRTVLAVIVTVWLVVAAAAAAATSPSVATLILRAEQVGPGYVLQHPADGRGVAASPTLNLCGNDYPSESRRLTRLQTNYVHSSTTLAISNEVVSYTPGGAAQAMREVIKHAANCKHHLLTTGLKSVPTVVVKVTRIQVPHLLKEYLAVRILTTGKLNGKSFTQTSFAVYQRHGDVLSGVYSSGLTIAPQLRLCLHAAEQSAHNLRQTASASKGPAA